MATGWPPGGAKDGSEVCHNYVTIDPGAHRAKQSLVEKTMLRALLLTALGWVPLAIGMPTSSITPLPGRRDPPPYNSSVRPLVLWHGLGDSYGSPGMLQFADLIREVHPGIFVHNIWVNEDIEKDQKAGFVSHVVPICRYYNQY